MNRRILLLAASVSCWAAVIVPASAQHFEQIPGSLTQVAAGRAEVWGINASQQVYRFNATTVGIRPGGGKAHTGCRGRRQPAADGRGLGT